MPICRKPTGQEIRVLSSTRKTRAAPAHIYTQPYAKCNALTWEGAYLYTQAFCQLPWLEHLTGPRNANLPQTYGAGNQGPVIYKEDEGSACPHLHPALCQMQCTDLGGCLYVYTSLGPAPMAGASHMAEKCQFAANLRGRKSGPCHLHGGRGQRLPTFTPSLIPNAMQ